LKNYLINPKGVVIIGYPLVHTFSPKLHNKAFEELGLDYVYFSLPIKPDDFFEMDKNWLKKIPFAGGNVTVPFKEKIIDFLDVLSPEAKQIGAVNTFYQKDGLIYGENTDWLGFLDSVADLREFFKDRSIMILGSGGSARAIVTALANLGVKEITIASRNIEKSLNFVQEKQSFFPEIKWNACELKKIENLAKYSVMINTTPVGMYEDLSPVSSNIINELNDNCLIYDLIYNPPETKLLKMGKERGLRTMNGKKMLIYQAARAFKLWTENDFPLQIADI